MRASILRLYASNLEQAQTMLSDVPNDRMAELPFEGAKHPAWTLGHLALGAGMVKDFIVGNPGGFGGVPEAWTAVCMPVRSRTRRRFPVCDSSTSPSGAVTWSPRRSRSWTTKPSG